jgi:signal transduction histidine kinase
VGDDLDGLRSGGWMTTLQGRAHALLAALAVAVLLVAFLWLTPMQSLAAAALALVATVAAAGLAARSLQVWVPPAAALAGLALCYPLWSWRRLEATQRYLADELARLRAEPAVLPEPPAAAGAVDTLDARLLAVRTATERLRNLRQFLTDVGMSLPDALLVADTSGRVLIANARAAEYLHAPSVAALQGRRLADEVAPLRIAGERAWDEVAAAAPASVEARHPDGRDLLFNIVPCTTHDGRRIGLIVRLADITSLKAAARQREELLRFLSHDMRSPQVSILMLVALARHAKSPPPVADTLAGIERYARRTLAFADDFVQLARAQAQDPAGFDAVDFGAVARDAADEAWPQAQAKAIRIERALDLAEPWVRGDRQLLARALANLLSNAIKYSPAESRVRVSLERDARHIGCAVADEGEGIPADALPRLFEPFQRFAAERHPEVDGSGLGLAFVKAVAERHAGRVTVESMPGRGSRFALWVPAEAGAA